MTNIPFRIKRLTNDTKIPTKENEGDLWDLYANNFCHKQYFEAEKNDLEKVNEFEPVTYGEEGYMYQRKEILFSEGKDDEGMELFDGIGVYLMRDEPLTQFNPNSVIIHPHSRVLIKTGIAIELPQNYGHGWKFEEDWIKYPENEKPEQYAVADIRPRSGLALKYGLTVLNTPGTIDNSYRKEIGVIMINHGHEPYEIKKGDKIAQMLIRPLYNSQMQVVDDVKDKGRGLWFNWQIIN
jgi:dUTP pyrophosphatase